MICVMACWWHNAKLVIDWHNFGYTIMAMTMGQRHPLVSLALLIGTWTALILADYANPCQCDHILRV